MKLEIIFQMAAVIVACAGGWLDYKTHKIPNKLTVACMIGGIASRFILGGMEEMLAGLLGWAVGWIFIVLWILGALKAGDIKLYMAVGAVGGWQFCLNTAIYSMIFGGITAVYLFVRRRSGMQELKHLWLYITNLLLIRKYTKYRGGEKSYFCFGWLIGAGGAAAFFLPLF